MLLPMGILAAGCVLFGVYNPLPLEHLVEPVIGARLEHSFSGPPHSLLLVAATLIVLALALANHAWGVKRSGRGVGASDHIHHAPGLSMVYDLAERRFFDPYDVGLALVDRFARLAFALDRAIDWLYDVAAPRIAAFLTGEIRAFHTGGYALYALWALGGLGLVLVLLGFQI
jgi:NADH-quinone oxidoreductase subunit L